MEKEPIIREATLSDAVQIFNLIREHQEDLICRPLGDIIQNIDRFIVAETEGSLIACASFSILPEIGFPERASVEVKSVAVSNAYRRRHIGSRLVHRILEKVRPFGPLHAIVLTFAPRFFTTLGFHEIPKTQVMHKLYMGCINCTKHENPFTCPEIAMSLNMRAEHKQNSKERTPGNE